MYPGQVTSRTNVNTVQTESVESENVHNQSQDFKQPQYFNLHYFHHRHPPSPPPSPDYDEIEEHSNEQTDYQPLQTDTRDYTSMYNTTTAAGKREAPSVEVEGKLYSIVDPSRREEHVYSTTQQ